MEARLVELEQDLLCEKRASMPLRDVCFPPTPDIPAPSSRTSANAQLRIFELHAIPVTGEQEGALTWKSFGGAAIAAGSRSCFAMRRWKRVSAIALLAGALPGSGTISHLIW